MNWYFSICFLVTLPLYLPLPLDLHLYLFRSCICFHCCIWICICFSICFCIRISIYFLFVFVFIFVFIFMILFLYLYFFRGQFKCFVFQMDFYYFLGLRSSSFIFYEFDHILSFCSFFDLTCWAIRNDEWIGSIQIVLTIVKCWAKILYCGHLI